MPSACRLEPGPRGMGQAAQAEHGTWQESHSLGLEAAPRTHLCNCIFHSLEFKQSF